MRRGSSTMIPLDTRREFWIMLGHASDEFSFKAATYKNQSELLVRRGRLSFCRVDRPQRALSF